MHLDTASPAEVLRLIHDEDRRAVASVEPELPHIEQAVFHVERALRAGGRLIYAGAGTSGRLGVLDAAECPPTFGTHPEQVQALIAGGDAAMFRAQEGAEDDEGAGAAAVDALDVGALDVVCGIAASRRTPYPVGAVTRARQRGATTLYVTCNPREAFLSSGLADVVDVAICLDVGPEALMGSTRMKSGTATKLVLNMLTTAAMVRLGKVYENMMVDLQLTNAKLVERSRKIVMLATGCDYGTATDTLRSTGGHVKTAIVMLKAAVNADEARTRIERADGFVQRAIDGVRSPIHISPANGPGEP